MVYQIIDKERLKTDVTINKKTILKFLELFEKAPINWNGHFYDISRDPDNSEYDNFVYLYRLHIGFLLSSYRPLDEFYKANENLFEAIKINDYSTFYRFEGAFLAFCDSCREQVDVFTNGKEIELRGENRTDCAHPEGEFKYTLKLEVPSGKIVAACNLSSIVKEEFFHEIDFISERYKLSKCYEEHGLIFLLDNRHPSLYKRKEGYYFIAKNCKEYDKWKHDYGYKLTPLRIREKPIYSFYRDRRAVSITSLENFEKKMADLDYDSVGDALTKLYASVLEIEPGTYEVTFHDFFNKTIFKDDKIPRVSTTLKRINS